MIDVNFDNFEIMTIEISVKNIKWILLGAYKPPKTKDADFLLELSRILNKTFTNYEHVLLLGDFNMTIENSKLRIR